MNFKVVSIVLALNSLCSLFTWGQQMKPYRDAWECMLFQEHIHNCNVTYEEACVPQNAKKTRENLYIVSIGHHGLGNQLFEHSFAFMLADYLRVPDSNVIITQQKVVGEGGRGNFIDSNTAVSFEASQLLFNLSREGVDANNGSLPSVCEQEPLVFPTGQGASIQSYRSLLSDGATRRRCLKLWGFFQHVSHDRPPLLCPARMHKDPFKHISTHIAEHSAVASSHAQTARRLPGSRDAAVYLRCAFHHYAFEDARYFEHILNATTYDQLFLFEAPDCQHVEHHHHFHYRYRQVVEVLTQHYGALPPALYVSLEGAICRCASDLIALILPANTA